MFTGSFILCPSFDPVDRGPSAIAGHHVGMARAHNGNIEIEYEIFGDLDDPTIIMSPGLGNQMLLYPAELCEAFVDRGFGAIRIDNRDAGLSSITSEDLEYTLHDMGDDVVAVLDDAGVNKAVVMGMSLGGMIAQTVAIDHPNRTLALVSVSSTSGEPDVGGATDEALAAIQRPSAPTIDEQVESDIEVRRIWSNPDWFDEEQIGAYFRSLYDRSFTPGGSERQMAAIMRSGDRAVGLAQLDMPTLVVHGQNDSLINISAGRRTAELVAGARFLEIEGMSHDFVSQMWPPLISAVTSLVASIP